MRRDRQQPSLFGFALLVGLFFHGILFPIHFKRKKKWALFLKNKLGVFIPPRELGVLVFVAALIFSPKGFFETTELNEYKEFMVPLIYLFILVRVFFEKDELLETYNV